MATAAAANVQDKKIEPGKEEQPVANSDEDPVLVTREEVPVQQQQQQQHPPWVVDCEHILTGRVVLNFTEGQTLEACLHKLATTSTNLLQTSYAKLDSKDQHDVLQNMRFVVRTASLPPPLGGVTDSGKQAYIRFLYDSARNNPKIDQKTPLALMKLVHVDSAPGDSAPAESPASAVVWEHEAFKSDQPTSSRRSARRVIQEEKYKNVNALLAANNDHKAQLPEHLPKILETIVTNQKQDKYGMYAKTHVGRWRIDRNKSTQDGCVYCMLVYDVLTNKWMTYIGITSCLKSRFATSKSASQSHLRDVLDIAERYRTRPDQLSSYQLVDLAAAAAYCQHSLPIYLFVVEGVADKTKRAERESLYIKTFDSTNPKHGLNLSA